MKSSLILSETILLHHIKINYLVKNLKAAILKASRKLEVTETKTPTTVRAGEAIIKIEYAAICGTDVHLFSGHLPARIPVILGHEYSGKVLMVGPGVRNFKPGDRVIGSYAVSCGNCLFCISGKTQLCKRRLLFGININGSFAQFMRIPLADRALIKVPDDIELRDAVLIPDMILTAFYAVDLSVKMGDDVLISGLGGVGLSAALVAKYAGAGLTIGVDVRERPLKVARQLGIDHVIDAREVNVMDEIKDLTDGLGVHVAIEASGAPIAVKTALNSIRPGGKLIQIGIIDKPVELDLKYLTALEKSITGALNPGNPVYLKKALNFIKPKINEFSRLVTHEFKLEDIVKAIEIAEKKIEDPIKILVRML